MNAPLRTDLNDFLFAPVADDANGVPAITYVDANGMGYTFAAERLSPQELLELVVSSDLIGRAQSGR